MSKLLVRRDPLLLVPIDGEVVNHGNMPRFLDEKVFGGHPDFFNVRYNIANGELPIRRKENIFITPPGHFHKNAIPAVWSGYRSCLTVDSETGELYKLKGMAVGKKPKVLDHGEMIQVLGGQFLLGVKNERKYCDRFNRVLRDNGINPVMEHVGHYKLPFLVEGKKLATSIMRIEGDTRLDELFYVFEILSRQGLNGNTNKFVKSAQLLYEDFGRVVAKMKRLMEKKRVVWSDSEDGPSNAHIGNIVVYGAGDKIKLGFVDFDATSDGEDIGQIARIRQHKRELSTLINSVFRKPISMREIGDFSPNYLIHPKNDGKKYVDLDIPQFLRVHFIHSFVNNYDIPLTSRETVSDEIDLARFQEVLSLLPEPVRVSVTQGIEEILRKDSDYFGAAMRNSFYNSDLNKKIKDAYEENVLSKKNQDDHSTKILESYLEKKKDRYSTGFEDYATSLIKYTS